MNVIMSLSLCLNKLNFFLFQLFSYIFFLSERASRTRTLRATRKFLFIYFVRLFSFLLSYKNVARTGFFTTNIIRVFTSYQMYVQYTKS